MNALPVMATENKHRRATSSIITTLNVVDCVLNMMAHAQKPDFVFWRNGRVHLNRQGRQFSRPLAAEVCASAVVMLDTQSSEVVWFPLHFPSRASPCAITFQLDSTQQHEVVAVWSGSGGTAAFDGRVRFKPQPLYPQGKSHQPQSWYGRFGGHKTVFRMRAVKWTLVPDITVTSP
jgi:hypothetical protein